MDFSHDRHPSFDPRQWQSFGEVLTAGGIRVDQLLAKFGNEEGIDDDQLEHRMDELIHAIGAGTVLLPNDARRVLAICAINGDPAVFARIAFQLVLAASSANPPTVSTADEKDALYEKARDTASADSLSTLSGLGQSAGWRVFLGGRVALEFQKQLLMCGLKASPANLAEKLAESVGSGNVTVSAVAAVYQAALAKLPGRLDEDSTWAQVRALPI